MDGHFPVKGVFLEAFNFIMNHVINISQILRFIVI